MTSALGDDNSVWHDLFLWLRPDRVIDRLRRPGTGCWSAAPSAANFGRQPRIVLRLGTSSCCRLPPPDEHADHPPRIGRMILSCGRIFTYPGFDADQRSILLSVSSDASVGASSTMTYPSDRVYAQRSRRLERRSVGELRLHSRSMRRRQRLHSHQPGAFRNGNSAIATAAVSTVRVVRRYAVDAVSCPPRPKHQLGARPDRLGTWRSPFGATPESSTAAGESGHARNSDLNDADSRFMCRTYNQCL